MEHLEDLMEEDLDDDLELLKLEKRRFKKAYNKYFGRELGSDQA